VKRLVRLLLAVPTAPIVLVSILAAEIVLCILWLNLWAYDRKKRYSYAEDMKFGLTWAREFFTEIWYGRVQ
jgi:hypothetical protein